MRMLLVCLCLNTYTYGNCYVKHYMLSFQQTMTIYIPVSYTFTFGPSLQSEQCRDIQIINDRLAERLEIFTVQLTTNGSAIELTTPQIMINIQDNDGRKCLLVYTCPITFYYNN